MNGDRIPASIATTHGTHKRTSWANTIVYLGAFRTFIGRCRLCREPAHVRAAWIVDGAIVVLYLCEDHSTIV